MKTYIFHPGLRRDSTRGSLTHFYHFMYGYLLPFIHELREGTIDKYILSSCGPMDRHLNNIPGHNIEIHPPHVLDDLTHPHISYKPWDKVIDGKTHLSGVTPEMFDKVNKTINSLYNIKTDQQDIDILLIKRSVTTSIYDKNNLQTIHHKYVTNCPGPTPAFYDTGAKRRSIGNIEDLQSQLSAAASVTVVELEGMNLYEQFKLFSSAKVIVAQHGAGLSHVFRASNKALVVEIVPIDIKKTCFKKHTMFERICQLNNIEYISHLQSITTYRRKKITAREAWSHENSNNHAPVVLSTNIINRITKYLEHECKP